MRPDWKKAMGTAVLLAVCTFASAQTSDAEVEVEATIKNSFRERGIATMDRLEQTDMQRECSKYSGQEVPKAVQESIEKKALESVKYPPDGEYLGYWKAGEKIAQSGRGFQCEVTERRVEGGVAHGGRFATAQRVPPRTSCPRLFG